MDEDASTDVPVTYDQDALDKLNAANEDLRSENHYY